MGLDMFLFKAKKEEIEGIDKYKLWEKEIEEVGYWRKANYIHLWFVNNVQGKVDDCGLYQVSQQNLEELKVLCEEVLKNNKKAEKLLPTKSGFFFGSTEYDEYYFQAIKNTFDILSSVIATTDFINETILYGSSW